VYRYYPGEHDPLTSILTPLERRLRRLNSYRHVRGTGHFHDATRRRLAHRLEAIHRSAKKVNSAKFAERGKGEVREERFLDLVPYGRHTRSCGSL
jgi:hypothetical protein